MTHTFEVTLTGYICIDAENEDAAREILDRGLTTDPDNFAQRNFTASGDQSKAKIEFLGVDAKPEAW